MLQRATLQLLRFHFSLFLLPVFLFALSQVPSIDWFISFSVFLILHFLVYPASNGYNSFMDRDVTPIGGLYKPLMPGPQLFWTTVVMDVVALVASLFINTVFALGILFYIIASRAYSYRKIRLKQYPAIGFLTVFIFQGALIFFIVFYSCGNEIPNKVALIPCVISSLLIGALYPLTQIYQHEADKNDGVITISYLLGKRGSFIFSGLLFSLAAILFYLYFLHKGEINHFYLFLLFTFPVVLFFIYWMSKVWKDESVADFKHSLLMNIVATFCTMSYFIALILLKKH